MILDAVLPMAGRLRGRVAGTLGIIALACLAVGACVAISSGPQSLPPDRPLKLPPATSVGIRAEALKFIPRAGSRAELHGTTNIGSWTSQSTDIQGRIILDVDENALTGLFDRIESAAPNHQGDGQAPPLILALRGRPDVDISVPVDSLHSDKPGMDRDMRVALKAGEHPAIDYTFEKVQQAAVQWNARDGRPGLKLHAVGKLTMAGVARPIEMDVIVTHDSHGHFLVHAQTALLMSDFDVTPPVALFGVIKAGERVEVAFDLDLLLKQHSPGRHP